MQGESLEICIVPTVMNKSGEGFDARRYPEPSYNHSIKSDSHGHLPRWQRDLKKKKMTTRRISWKRRSRQEDSESNISMGKMCSLWLCQVWSKIRHQVTCDRQHNAGPALNIIRKEIENNQHLEAIYINGTRNSYLPSRLRNAFLFVKATKGKN